MPNVSVAKTSVAKVFFARTNLLGTKSARNDLRLIGLGTHPFLVGLRPSVVRTRDPNGWSEIRTGFFDPSLAADGATTWLLDYRGPANRS